MAEEITTGEGWATGSIDALGDGPGFRKIRTALDVKAFGVNAIVLPGGASTGFHFHDEQEELYLVHRGAVEIQFGDDDGQTVRLEAGGLARVDAATPRRVASVGDEDAVYVVVGGKDGYVGRDGRRPEGEERMRSG